MILDSDLAGRQAYGKINFGEFVDVVCRLTILAFEKSEMANLKLAEKLKFTLAEMLSTIFETIEMPVIEVQSIFNGGDPLQELDSE